MPSSCSACPPMARQGIRIKLGPCVCERGLGTVSCVCAAPWVIVLFPSSCKAKVWQQARVVRRDTLVRSKEHTRRLCWTRTRRRDRPWSSFWSNCSPTRSWSSNWAPRWFRWAAFAPASFAQACSQCPPIPFYQGLFLIVVCQSSSHPGKSC